MNQDDVRRHLKAAVGTAVALGFGWVVVHRPRWLLLLFISGLLSAIYIAVYDVVND